MATKTKTKRTARLTGLRIVVECDESPDTSFIGRWTDNMEDWAIDRKTGEYIHNQPEDWQPPSKGREFRFFKPYAGGEKEGTKEYQEYGKKDWECMEGLCDGDWQMVGVMVRATFLIEPNCGTFHSLDSPGLWGVESDSSKDHFREIATEEANQLKGDLEALNIDLDQWDNYLKQALENIP